MIPFRFLRRSLHRLTLTTLLAAILPLPLAAQTRIAGTNSSGAAVPVQVTTSGILKTSLGDPCTTGTRVYVPVSIAAEATTEIVGTASGAGNYVYICSVNLVSAGANNVALVEDDSDACASPSAGMAGGVTAATGWNLAANAILNVGNGSAAVFKTAAANRYVCLMTSAAGQLSGAIVYALGP